MKMVHTTLLKRRVSQLAVPALAMLLLLGATFWSATEVAANHPVFVEGNCLNPPAGNPGPVAPGTCGDYDGDGRIGTAEDTDGDRVFGTITAALANATGANQNGRVTIVTSGVFAEVVNITAANGNVTLEAAPGVEADVDAVLQGDPGSGARQNSPGIIVNAPADRFVIIRNLTSRNWAEGIRVLGVSSVLIDNCRIENNANYGIRVQGSARVKINETQVTATGYRVGVMDFPRVNRPNPGIGIEYEDSSTGLVCRSCVTGSFGEGLNGRSVRQGFRFNIAVEIQDACFFNNNRGR